MILLGGECGGVVDGEVGRDARLLGGDCGGVVDELDVGRENDEEELCDDR